MTSPPWIYDRRLTACGADPDPRDAPPRDAAVPLWCAQPVHAATASGTATVMSHGPADRCLDLVLVADGFPPDGQERFARQVRSILTEILATEPLGRLRGLLNVHRVDPAPGRPRLTTGFAGDDGRLLLVDQQAALEVAHQHVPGTDVVLVVVDTARYGGSGGTVAATTCHPRAAALAVHELGHAAFDLADEYGRDGRHPGPAPSRVNVTLDPDPAHAPWADLVGTDGVGCHEGGDGYASGVYRPAATCRMRSLAAPFCPVCSREIRRLLLTRRTPADPGQFHRV